MGSPYAIFAYYIYLFILVPVATELRSTVVLIVIILLVFHFRVTWCGRTAFKQQHRFQEVLRGLRADIFFPFHNILFFSFLSF